MSDCGCGKGTISCQTNQKILTFVATVSVIFAMQIFSAYPVASSLFILTSVSTVIYNFYGDTVLEFLNNNIYDFDHYFANDDISDTSNKKEELVGEIEQNTEIDPTE